MLNILSRNQQMRMAIITHGGSASSPASRHRDGKHHNHGTLNTNPTHFDRGTMWSNTWNQIDQPIPWIKVEDPNLRMHTSSRPLESRHSKNQTWSTQTTKTIEDSTTINKDHPSWTKTTPIQPWYPSGVTPVATQHVYNNWHVGSSSSTQQITRNKSYTTSQSPKYHTSAAGVTPFAIP